MQGSKNDKVLLSGFVVKYLWLAWLAVLGRTGKGKHVHVAWLTSGASVASGVSMDG